jgi:O-antigen/teichoic acid export membrane protein
MLIRVFLGAGAISGLGLAMQVFFFAYAANELLIGEFALLTQSFAYGVLISQLALFGYPQVITRLLGSGGVEQQLVGVIGCLLVLVLSLLSLLVAFDCLWWFSGVIICLFLIKFCLKRIAMGLGCANKTISYDELFWVLPCLMFLMISKDFVYLQYVVVISLVISCVKMFSIVTKHGFKISFSMRLWGLKEYFYPALFVVVFLLGRLLINRFDVIFIAGSYDDLVFSAYSLAHRLSYIIIFPSLIFGILFSGKVAQLYKAGSKVELSTLVFRGLAVAAGVSLFLMLFIFIFIDYALREYAGGQFSEFKTLFIALVLSQVVISLAGINQMVIMMTGNERYLAYVSFITALTIMCYCNLYAVERGPVFVAYGVIFYSVVVVIASWFKTISIVKGLECT